jgi:hypothetical protein
MGRASAGWLQCRGLQSRAQRIAGPSGRYGAGASACIATGAAAASRRTTSGLIATMRAGPKMVAKATSLASGPVASRTTCATGAKVGLDHGVKVGRRIGKRGISADQPRRDVQCAAEGDGQVRQVTAHAATLHEHIARGAGGRGRADAVLDMLAHPLADRADTRMASGQAGEELLRHGPEQIRFAIARRQQVAQHVVGQFIHRPFRRSAVDVIGMARDHRAVVQLQRPGAGTQPQHAVARMHIDEDAMRYAGFEP